MKGIFLPSKAKVREETLASSGCSAASSVLLSFVGFCRVRHSSNCSNFWCKDVNKCNNREDKIFIAEMYGLAHMCISSVYLLVRQFKCVRDEAQWDWSCTWILCFSSYQLVSVSHPYFAVHSNIMWYTTASACSSAGCPALTKAKVAIQNRIRQLGHLSPSVLLQVTSPWALGGRLSCIWF